jgi:hypothetical protein
MRIDLDTRKLSPLAAEEIMRAGRGDILTDPWQGPLVVSIARLTLRAYYVGAADVVAEINSQTDLDMKLDAQLDDIEGYDLLQPPAVDNAPGDV